MTHAPIASPGLTTRRLAALMLLALASPALAEPIAQREVLPNGIVLLVAERPAVPIVAVRVLLQAGAVYDPPERVGLANLTSALLTRGTLKHTGPELDSAIEFVGGSLEVGAGRDNISASVRVLRKDLGLGLDLLSEVIQSPTFPPAEVTRKIGKIQAAIKHSEEDPQTVARWRLAGLVFPGHRYGLPVEGTRESVARLTRDDVVKFYRERFRPDATVVAVVGAVTLAEARREILARFGSWSRPADPLAVVASASAGPPPRQELIARDLTQATVMLGRQAIRQTDPDYFPLVVASHILGGGSSSRLFTRVREEAGLAYSVRSSVSPSKFGSAFFVSARTRSAEVAKVQTILKEELAHMTREPTSDAELSLAKAYLVGSLPLRLDTSAKVAEFVAGVEELGLGLDYADRYRAGISHVTAGDVQRAAQRFFDPESFSQIVVGRIP